MRKQKKTKSHGGGPRRSGVSGFTPFIPTPVNLGLREAERLLSRGDMGAALDRLDDLNRKYPGHEPVLEMLLTGALALEDPDRCLTALEGLQTLRPDDPLVSLTLPPVYFMNALPALGIRALHRLSDRLAEGGGFTEEQRREATELLESLNDLDAAMRDDLEKSGLGGDEGFELAWRTDLQNLRLRQERYEEVDALTEEMLSIRPRYAPALNNQAQVEWLRGDLEKAVGVCRRVIGFEPDNIHALSNLSRFLLLSGDEAEARKTAAALLASKAPSPDRALKIAEALSCLGDDAAVLDVFKKAYSGAFTRAERDGKQSARKKAADEDDDEGLDDESLDEMTEEDATVHHLAAVAALRLGREHAARGLWRQALRIDPEIPNAAENLSDLDEAIGEREGPWAFSFAYWLPEVVRRGIAEESQALQKRVNQTRRSSGQELEGLSTTFSRGLLARFPLLSVLVPILLDRGDPQGREFCLRLAAEAKTPEAAAVLRDFALGVRGSDHLRMRAAQAAVQAGLIDPGKVRMYLQGEQQETLLLAFEISDDTEDPSPHSSKVVSLMEKGIRAMKAGNGVQAEQAARQALAIEPDAPDVWNNLAAALSLQGRTEESKKMLIELYERRPDYFFAITNRAILYMQDDDVNAARELLEPLLKKPRLHTSEFTALVAAQVRLGLAEKSADRAISWLRLFDSSDLEESAMIQSLRPQVEMLEIIQGIQARLPGRRQKKKTRVLEASPQVRDE